MTILNVFGLPATRKANRSNLGKRATLQKGKWRPVVKTATPKKRVISTPKVETVCYDSDDSQYYKPSNIIKKIHAEQEKEEEERAKAREVTSKLSYYPSCWLALGMVATSRDYIKKMGRMERIYNQVHASMIDQGVINSDNDPDNDTFEDPLALETCEVCGKPHDNGDVKTSGWENALISCYVERKDKSILGCRKWYHVGCVGRKEIPKGDWCCYKCSKQLNLAGHDTNAHNMHVGVEFEVDDVDEGFDGTKAKQAAKTDSQANKGADLGDDDSLSDEDKTEDGGDGSKANPKNGAEDKDNGSNPMDAFFDAKAESEESDDHKDETFVAESEASYEADTEDEEVISSGRKKKKHAGGKKRAAVGAQESPVAKKKKGDRVTGEKPENSKQLFDFIVRKKLKACRASMETLQHMSLPIKRSDKYVAPDDSDDESQEVIDQQGWPWMIHSLSCYTEMKPNDDGGKGKGTFLKKPEYHMFAGSKAAAQKLRVSFAPVTDMKIIVHSSFDEYYNAFRSESAKAKEAPPEGKKKTTTTTKKKPYKKRWANRDK